MDKQERKLIIEIMSDMLQVAFNRFEKEGMEHFVHFKIIGREVRMGDYSLAEEIVVDNIKEYSERQNETEESA